MQLLNDARFGLRALVKNRGFAAVAILTLALGVGANTALFSVVNAVLLRPLPFPAADRLVTFWTFNHGRNIERGIASPADFADWRNESRSFAEMAAWRTWFYNIRAGAEAEQVWGVRTSANYFHLLGVHAAFGRTFSPEEEQPGRDHVAILSYGLWQRMLGGDPAAIGKSIEIDGKPFTIVGILPADFNFFGTRRSFDLWMPFAFDRENLKRDDRSLIVYARLKPGATIRAAQADLTAIADRLAQEFPETNRGWGVQVVSLYESQVTGLRPALFLLLAAVGVVLLIACSNVANLLFARASARQKEIAIRTALGASRLRLIRQLLTENALLGLLGGALGVALAFWGLDLLRPLAPAYGLGAIPRLDAAQIDFRVLAFALAISLLTGILFGLAPAFQATRANLNQSLKESGRSSDGGRRGGRLRDLLVVTQVALALTLLIGAGLLMRSFFKLLDVNPGINAHSVLTAQVWLPESRYPEARRIPEFYEQVLTRLARLPGVQSASAINFLPLSAWGDSVNFSIEGRAEPQPGEMPIGQYRVIASDYFQTLGLPILSGRALDQRDAENAPGAAIISADLARRYWPRGDAIGQHIRLKFPQSDAPWRPVARDSWLKIVGIAGDIRQPQLSSQDIGEIYLPLEQNPSRLMRLAVRSATEPDNLALAIRREVLAVDAEQPITELRSMEQFASESVFQRRLSMVLLSLFAALALTLAAVGIYGVISYAVGQRTREIGIRVALGARPTDVSRLVTWQGMRLALAGVAAGLTLAFALTRILSSQLFEVSALDSVTFAAVPALLIAVALAACYIPARRAARIDPLIALRHD